MPEPERPPPAPAGDTEPEPGPRAPGRPPPANRGAAIGRRLDDVGRSAASAGQHAAISGGSIVVGLMAYALGVNYMQHGWPGIQAWLKAKLWNETSEQGSGIPQAYFHTGSGAGTPAGSSTGTQLAAAAPPERPAAPIPSGGILYA